MLNPTGCSDDSRAAAYYKKSGQPAAGESPGRQAIYAQVGPFDGVWKVTALWSSRRIVQGYQPVPRDRR